MSGHTPRLPERLIKYPSTPHVPWSLTKNRDDTMLRPDHLFDGQPVVVTEKIDGESTTMTPHTVHARSLETPMHPSRSWVRALHGRIRWQIPNGWRLCGENAFAMHSIFYDDLPSYFLLFSVWDEHNVSRPWAEVESLAAELSLMTAPVLWQGIYDPAALQKLAENLDTERQEGYVVRLQSEIPFTDFSRGVAKWVRRNHVQTDEHWLSKPVIPNRLRAPVLP